jgi:hypothetical protein
MAATVACQRILSVAGTYAKQGQFANRLRGFARASPTLLMVIDLRQCAGYGLGGMFDAPHLSGLVSDAPPTGAL